MECPHCGESSGKKSRVLSVRTSHDFARTRQRECFGCGKVYFSVEIPIEKGHVTCYKHYHVRKNILLRLIKALHGHEQG